MKTCHCQKFTLIEILAVMSIIVILVGASMAVMPRVKRFTSDKATNTYIMNLQSALQLYFDEWAYYPQASGPTQLKDTWVDGIVTESGRPLIDWDHFKTQDAYGSVYYYQCPGVMNTELFDIWSAGYDGKFGSAPNDNAASAQRADSATMNADDLTNWKANN